MPKWKQILGDDEVMQLATAMAEDAMENGDFTTLLIDYFAHLITGEVPERLSEEEISAEINRLL